MLRAPVEDQSNCSGNGGSCRFRILKSHWKCSLTLIAILFFAVGCGLVSTTAMPTESVLIIDPRTRNKIHPSDYNQDNITVCTSEECKRAALKLKGPMNSDVDPCEDFYEYACGNWQREHYDWFSEIQINISTLIVREFLKRPVEASDPKPVQLAKDWYNSCTDTEKIEKEGLQPIINILKSVGLPVFPTYGSSDHNKTNDFDWLETAVKIKTNLNIDVLIALNFESKTFIHAEDSSSVQFMRKSDASNNERRIISSRKSVLEQQIPSDTEQEQYRKVLELFAREMSNKSELPAYIDIQSKTFTRAIQVIADIKTFELNYDSATHNKLDNILQKYITSLSLSTGEHIDTFHLKVEEQYYKLFAEYISKTPPKELELYMWMKVVLKLGKFSTKKLRDIILLQNSNEESRSELCSTIVDDIAVPYFPKVAKAQISAMIHEVKRSLKDQIAQVEWMDDKTKSASYEKIDQMKYAIGYSESDKSYDDIHIDSSKHVLYNLMNIEQAEIKTMVRKLNKNSTCGIVEPTEVNAFFTPSLNCLRLPWGILRYPFYDLGLKSLNYGSLGSVVGHEVSHAFDNKGIQYDKNGNWYQWWTNDSTYNSFYNISSCFIHQYSTYHLAALPVNGSHTLGENMADNNGVRAAFAALKRHLDERIPEPKLPDFEHMSSEKLFFLSYASTWCSKNTGTYEELLEQVSDEHTPNRFRVNGVLQNNKDFAKTWNCKPNSYMNPTNKCILF